MTATITAPVFSIHIINSKRWNTMEDQVAHRLFEICKVRLVVLLHDTFISDLQQHFAISLALSSLADNKRNVKRDLF